MLQRQAFLLDMGESIEITPHAISSSSPWVEYQQKYLMGERSFDKPVPRTDKASLMVQVDWVSSQRFQRLEHESNTVDLVGDWEEYLVADSVLESAEGLILKRGPMLLRLRFVYSDHE